MLEEGTVAIAKGVIGQSEHLLVLIPTDTGILAETLFFHDEVKSMPKRTGKAGAVRAGAHHGKKPSYRI